MWNAGYTGQGIDIAVIDTGIARVPGLDAAGKVIDGPDLSFDPHDATYGGIDAFGHGTHMAGHHRRDRRHVDRRVTGAVHDAALGLEPVHRHDEVRRHRSRRPG